MSEGVVCEVATWVARLAEVYAHSDATAPFPTGPVLSDRDRVDLLTALEGLKAAASAAQARVTVAFAASQREALTAAAHAAGADAGRQARDLDRDVDRSIGAQVALARRVSSREGGRHLGAGRAPGPPLPQRIGGRNVGGSAERGAG